MKYEIIETNRFKKHRKACAKRGYDMRKLKEVVKLLAEGESLAAKYKDHALSGNKAGFRECHISPDWLLIYQIDNGVLILTLCETGTHSDLFSL